MFESLLQTSRRTRVDSHRLVLDLLRAFCFRISEQVVSVLQFRLPVCLLVLGEMFADVALFVFLAADEQKPIAAVLSNRGVQSAASARRR
jgi:hypothetical protein